MNRFLSRATVVAYPDHIPNLVGLRSCELATRIVEILNNLVFAMATMNFSIPDAVRDAFNREFSGQNKSAVIVRLMQQAIAQAEQQRRRQAAFEQLTAARSERPALSEAAARAARESSRP